MHSIASLYAEEALRLANERLDGFRNEADWSRFANARSRRSRFDVVRSALASLRSAVTSVDPVSPGLPSLSDYPYRS